LTQTKSFFDQLELGVRCLDIYPMLPQAGKRALHRAAEDKLGWQGAHNAIQHAIGNGKSFTATSDSDSLRCDPWQGIAKTCAVLYKQDDIIKFKGSACRKNLASTSSRTPSPSLIVPSGFATSRVSGPAEVYRTGAKVPRQQWQPGW
jgi:hypothetical protein